MTKKRSISRSSAKPSAARVTKKRSISRSSAKPSAARITCFLSYCTEDHRYAEALAALLRDRGVVTLNSTDADIIGFGVWVSVLHALQRASILIVIGTPASLRSEWVQREVDFFSRLDRPVLTILFRHLTQFEDIPILLKDKIFFGEDGAALHDRPSDRIVEYALSLAQQQPPTFEALMTPRVEDTRPLNEGKLILVGRGGAGKTSLMRRLTNNEFRGDESKTEGINITKWPLRCGSEILNLNVWDFGGQEIMHATHQFFLTEQSLYLLVLNGREGAEDIDAEYWLKHIECFGGKSPVIIVQNKINEHSFELNYRGLHARYPQIRGFVKTDCKESIGLNDLREAIQQVVTTMPEIRMPFPASWFYVKTRLESMENDFMGYDRFCELCHQQGIEDQADRDTLSWVLHCLGIAVNYRDDPRLRETSVLKPEWVTQGIYGILNAKTLAERQGELHLDDLQTLLPKNRYPVVKHHFMLELMRKFSLCFPFPDDADRYLVPELLAKEEPNETCAFVPSDCLNFEYHYGVLPEGLMPRFIVRSHVLSLGEERWRFGVILAHEECKALVTAEPLNRRIVVRVQGGDSGARRRLLAIVRYDLDRINADFKDRLDAQSKVPLIDCPEFCVDYKKLVAFEKQGVGMFPEFTGERVVTVKVSDLLNGVDLEAQRVEQVDAIASAKLIFFSYSHKDEELRDQLETHLKLLQRQGVVSAWHDRKILPGSDWDREIDRNLERAELILLLISPDFIASEYCWGKELGLALERDRSGEATVIPIMLRSCDWQNSPFSRLEGLPKDMKPITLWPDRDAAWTDVALGIREIAEKAK